MMAIKVIVPIVGDKIINAVHGAASMSRTFCPALGIAFEIGLPNKFKRLRIKITTTKTFTILMTECQYSVPPSRSFLRQWCEPTVHR
jgi:hypothetical protein